VAATEGQGTYTLRENLPQANNVPSLDDLPVNQGKTLASGKITVNAGWPLAQSLPKDGAWSTFQGNTGSGSSGSGPMPAMIDTVKDAPLAWLSHDRLPHGEGSDLRSSRKPGETVMGGFGSPAVNGGRVVLAYYRPAGTQIPTFFMDRDSKSGGALFAALIQADDIVHGFDAATGATAWKTVFPLKSANRGVMHKSGFQGSPFVQGDSVYVMGNLLRMYCLDGATGLPRWESDLGPGHQRATAAFLAALAGGKHMGGTSSGDAKEWMNRGLQGNPRLIGGVLVAHDGQRWNAGCVGLDPATGKRLWHVSGVGSSSVPLVWRKEGREYVIAVGGGGFTCALDPTTGKVLWRSLEFDAGYIGANAVCGDVLVGFDGTTKRRSGFRMTLDACTKIWELADEQTGAAATPATCHNGRLYCFSKDTKTLQVIDPETGKLLASAEHAPGTIIEHGSMIVGAGNRLFTDNGRELQGLFVWDVEQPQPKLLGLLGAPRTAGYAVAITPAIVDGRLFMRLSDRLAAFDLRKR
jgi:outer membrane protein assembly factor BamB